MQIIANRSQVVALSTHTSSVQKRLTALDGDAGVETG